MNEVETIKEIFAECKVIAVVGLSSSPMRPSNGVAAFMKKKGYRVIPVNPNESEVLGEKAVAHLSSIEEKVDLVNIFRRSDEVGKSGGRGD
ncbi:MAG: CoA-binding protein [Pyrinomonadaceae bacterium]